MVCKYAFCMGCATSFSCQCFSALETLSHNCTWGTTARDGACLPCCSCRRVWNVFFLCHMLQSKPTHVVDSDPRFEIIQWVDELANVSLIQNGLLGCTPTSPEFAITFQCLELYHQLWRRQSSFSIQAYTKVLCVLHGVSRFKSYVITADLCWGYISPSLCNQFSMTFDVYLAFLRTIQCPINQVLRQDDPSWRLWHYCPACTFKVCSQPPYHSI